MPRELQQLRGTNHIQLPTLCLPLAINECPLLGVKRTSQFQGALSAFDAVDGARSAASKWYRLVVSKPERFKEVRPGNDDGV